MFAFIYYQQKVKRQGEKIGDCVVDHKYDISELCIRDWRKKKGELNSSNNKKQESSSQWNTEVFTT